MPLTRSPLIGQPLWHTPRDSSPRSRRHKLMNSIGDGGPARTRTWDQDKCVVATLQPSTSVFTAHQLRRNTYSTQNRSRHAMQGDFDNLRYILARPIIATASRRQRGQSRKNWKEREAWKKTTKGSHGRVNIRCETTPAAWPLHRTQFVSVRTRKSPSLPACEFVMLSRSMG